MTGFGDLLRQARDVKGVSLREAERATRISRNYLAALEGEEFTYLPAATYARGIVRNYAQYLGLDPATVVEKFEKQSGNQSDSFALLPATGPIDAQSHWVPNFAIIAFMVVMSAVVFAWMYSAYFQETGSLATTTVGVATVTPVSGSILGVTTPVATIPVQGGGMATTTPEPEPTATAPAQATPEPGPATPEAQNEPAEEAAPLDASTEEPADESAEDAEAAASGSGAHAFVIWVIEDVWVQVTLNGEAEPAFDDVLPAGSERVFYGDSVTISSGNAEHVRLWVDGEDYGTLGDSWDATFTYP
jgi:cytoskeleton protein RodZ